MPERDVFLADCPARSTLELISGTWTVVVLVGLGHGPRRYSELLGRIGGISRKMLTQTLRASERAGLVEPPSRRGGGYRLTELGESLMGPLTALTEWAEQHADDLAAVPLGAGPVARDTSPDTAVAPDTAVVNGTAGATGTAVVNGTAGATGTAVVRGTAGATGTAVVRGTAGATGTAVVNGKAAAAAGGTSGFLRAP